MIRWILATLETFLCMNGLVITRLKRRLHVELRPCTRDRPDISALYSLISTWPRTGRGLEPTCSPQVLWTWFLLKSLPIQDNTSHRDPGIARGTHGTATPE